MSDQSDFGEEGQNYALLLLWLRTKDGAASGGAPPVRSTEIEPGQHGLKSPLAGFHTGATMLA